MRRRISKFSIDDTNNAIDLGDGITYQLEDIRLIVNETQRIVICSSMQKFQIEKEIEDSDETQIIEEPIVIDSDGHTITVNRDICALDSSDQITLEVDTADALSDVTDNVRDYVYKEHTTTRTAITATQTAILQAVSTAVQDAAEMNKQAYSARFEQNTDTENSYTLVLPIIAGVDETTQTATL